MSGYNQGFEDALSGFLGFEKNAGRQGYMRAVGRTIGKKVKEVAAKPKPAPQSALRQRRVVKLRQAPAANPKAAPTPANAPAGVESGKQSILQRMKKPGMLAGGLGLLGGAGYLGATMDQGAPQQYPMQYNY